MIEIYIDNRLIELDNTDISLQKEFSDEIENIPTEVEYSYTISIPATMNNREIFGFTDAFDVANKFKRLYNADLYVDGSLILSGKFKATSIESGYYKGNIYNPKKQTISEILGERNLNEIQPHYKPMNVLGDFDKINNYVCGLTTDDKRLPGEWDCASAATLGYTCEQISQVKDNHVVYPYILYGLPQMNPDAVSVDADIYTQDLEYGKHTISDDSIYPAFNVVSVLKDMFKTEGYNLTGNIIDGNMKDFFGGLYQTFQYSQADYVKKKEVPFFCQISGSWQTHRPVSSGIFEPHYTASKTLEVMDLWDADEFRCEQGDDVDSEGHFQYGVDNPLTSDCNHITFISDDYKMFTKGTSNGHTGILTIPKSGWYRIYLNGSMQYTLKGSQIITGVETLPIIPVTVETGDQMVGGTTDEADNTDLSEQPFEIQLKKGIPKEHPTLYSFNSFIPMNPTQYVEDNSVAMEADGNTYIKIQDRNVQRRYPKNGCAAYVKDYSGFQTNDFICGARVGGAWFSSQWGPAGRGSFQRKNRYYAMGAGLALPDVTKPIRVKQYEQEGLDNPYKANQGHNFDGYYMQLASQGGNSNYEYAQKTAQCLVRQDSYTNFPGYNEIVGTDGNYRWDTTSNYGAVTWEGADTCSAITHDNDAADFTVNTVVWLEQGDNIYLEVLTPLHTGGEYEHSTGCRHSSWKNRRDWINATFVSYILNIGFLNGNKDWKPRPGDGIEPFEKLAKHKLTNVNQFLPQTKCNDYLEKFLKTFNLQLTRVDSDTFSIDTIGGMNMMGNVIDIDGKCNIDDAEFKPLKSESIKEYKWKIDNTETGYVQGNASPHMSGHGESASASTYYLSGYTGGEVLENDTNSSGSVKKNEAPWSYNWYKTIHFLHNYYPSPITEEYADISVISDADMWKDGMTFAVAATETPQTSKTMRLFTLKKNQELKDKMYSYISFKYADSPYDPDSYQGTQVKYDMVCNLVLPSNYYETITIDDKIHRLHLDYKIMNNSFDGKTYNNSLMDVFFSKNVNGGYDIEVPIKLSNADYANTRQGTLYKLNDGLYRVKQIEGHDVNMEDDSTLTLTTLK